MGKNSDGVYREEATYCGRKVSMSAWESDNQSRLFTKDHTKFSVSLKVGETTRVFQYQCNTRYTEPKLNDIMDCLLSDYYAYLNARDVQDFMNEFGYEDEKQAKRIYEACGKQKEKLDDLFGGESVVEKINDFFYNGEEHEEDEPER